MVEEPYEPVRTRQRAVLLNLNTKPTHFDLFRGVPRVRDLGKRDVIRSHTIETCALGPDRIPRLSEIQAKDIN